MIKLTHKQKYKALTWVSVFTLMVAFALVLHVLFTLLYPYKTLDVKNAPMPIVGNKVLKAGDNVVYHYDYCKYYDKPLSITKQFVDGIIYTADPTYTVNLPKGCHALNVSVQIPDTLPDGNYKIRITTEIRVSPFRVIEKVYETQSFYVEGHPDELQDKELGIK